MSSHIRVVVLCSQLVVDFHKRRQCGKLRFPFYVMICCVVADCYKLGVGSIVGIIVGLG